MCHKTGHRVSRIYCSSKGTDEKGCRHVSGGCRVLESPTPAEESEQRAEDR